MKEGVINIGNVDLSTNRNAINMTILLRNRDADTLMEQ